jgi:CRP/FNR family transcriptional regulator, cyclic AMP receptor protein
MTLDFSFALSTISLFHAMPVTGLRALARQGRSRTFAPGDVLMRQGDQSDCLHIIVGGQVRVERSHPQILSPVVLAELGPGTVVGEMGVIDNLPRSATVTAVTETHTLEVHATVLSKVIEEYPDVAMALLRLLTNRLRSTDELTDDIHRQQTSLVPFVPPARRRPTRRSIRQ